MRFFGLGEDVTKLIIENEKRLVFEVALVILFILLANHFIAISGSTASKYCSLSRFCKLGKLSVDSYDERL